MPTYGQYETVQVPYRGPRTTLYLARKLGSDDQPKVAIKAMESLALVDREQAEEQAKRFLDAARVQKALTESGARHWSPVREVGMSPGGAFYVTDFYPTTIAKMLDGQVRLPGRAIHHVVSGVVDGLVEIQSSRRRGHGALRPSRVLLSKAQSPERAKVVLTTPSAESAEGPAGELEDVRSVGRMLYQMLFFQPFRELGGWPVAESPEFEARFGDKAEGWRALLNRILSPSAQAGELSLASIKAELGTLKPSGKSAGGGGGGGSAKWVLVGAVALAVVGGGGYVAYSTLGGGGGSGGGGGTQQATSDEEAAALLSRFYGRVWVLRSLEGLPERVDGLAGEPWWSENVTSPARAALAGASFAERGNMPARTVSRARTASVQSVAGGLDGLLSLGTEDRQLQAALDGLALSSWPALVPRAALAPRLSGLGLARLAEEMLEPEQAFARAAPVEGTSDEIEAWNQAVADAVDRVVEQADGVDQLALLLDRQDAIRAGLAVAGDPILDAFPWPVDASNELATLDVVVEQVLERVGVGDELTRALDDLGDAVPDDLRSQPIYEAVAAGEIGGRAALEEWLDLARDPSAWETVEMPSWVASVTRQAEQVRTNAADAAQRALPGGVDSGAWQPTLTRAGLIEDDALGIVEELADLDPTGAQVLDPEDFREQLAELDEDLSRVLTEQGDLVRFAQANASEAERAVATLRSQLSISQSVAVNQWWVEQRDEAIDRLASQPGELVDRGDELRDFANDVELAVNASLSDRLGVMPEWVDRGELDEIESAHREALLERTLARWEPDADASSFGVRRAHAEWLDGVADMVGGLDRARSAWAGELAGPDDLLKSVDTARSSALWDELEPAVASVARLADRLEGVPDGDTGTLLDLVNDRDGQLALRLLAWESLGRQAQWPDPGTDLLRDAAATAALLEAIEAHDARDAAARATQRVRRESVERVTRALDAVVSEDDLSSVESVLDELEIQPTQLGSATGRYNLLVRSFRDEFAGIGDNTERGRRLAQDFLSQTASLAGSLPAQTRDVRAQLAAAVRPAQPSGGGGNLAGVGPGSAGWTLANGDPNAPVYRAPGGETIEFRRLNGAGQGGRAVYMSRGEVSIGQFNALVARDARGYYASVPTSLWTEYPPESSRQLDGQFRVWSFDDGSQRLVPSPVWVGTEHRRNSFEVPIYSANPRIDPGRPDENTPMTAVSAVAADIAAARAGCRLPSEAEWRAARSMAAGGATWNLRDQTVADQASHVRTVWDPVRNQRNYPPGVDGQAFTFESDKQMGRVATQQSDGELWFWGVDAGPEAAFRNIVGNVAEFINNGTGGRIDPGDLRGTVRNMRYGIIGGSALSAGSPDEAVTLRRSLLGSAFADVGFRLVFEADAPSAPQAPPEVDLGPIVARLYSFE